MRPIGPVRIEKTKMVSQDMLAAKLSGAVDCTVAIVRKGGKYYFAAPPSMGGAVRKIEASSLTDCLHEVVYRMGEKISKKDTKIPEANLGRPDETEKKSGGGCP